MSRTHKVAVAFAAVLAITCVLFAQDAVKTLTVDVDVVLIPVTVTNDRGQYVGGLERKHFEVYEDKIKQDIVYFSTEDAPMSLGIVLDTSGSMGPIMDAARRNGQACTDTGTVDDEYFLIVFSDKLKVNTDFTTDLRNLRMQLLSVTSKGSTALYDAIYAGLSKLRNGTHPRKALVVVSDGLDNNSRYSGRNVREALKESDVQLYLIGNENDGALRAAAETSGGRSLSPRGTYFELGNICKQIVDSLKNQYLIGYKSTNEAKDGKWRNVRVALDPPAKVKLNARWRTGYFAPNETP